MQNPNFYIWLSLVLSTNSTVFKKLILHFDDAKAVYEASYEDIVAAGFDESVAQKLENKDFTETNRIIDICADLHIEIVCYNSYYYPTSLYTLTDPPPVLYCVGKINLLRDSVKVSMVGTRKCTETAKSFAYKSAYTFGASGVTVVTGLASGIDGICSLGALDGGGTSIGVLGCGVDRVYPVENAELFSRMRKTGLIISEFPPFTEPRGLHFPIRNRIISGLSGATIVVEAGERSGALITAHCALMQGRKLFAVPGDVTKPECEGTNNLIKNSAYTFTDPWDIIKDYALMYPDRIYYRQDIANGVELPELPKKKEKAKKKTKKEKAFKLLKSIKKEKAVKKNKDEQKEREKLGALSDTEREIYLLFEGDELSVDFAVAKGYSSSDVLSAFTMLEMQGLIQSAPGGVYIRNKK